MVAFDKLFFISQPGVITLDVREWNTRGDYLADNNNPDREGMEQNGAPINDRKDWKDATPGSKKYIGLDQ